MLCRRTNAYATAEYLEFTRGSRTGEEHAAAAAGEEKKRVFVRDTGEGGGRGGEVIGLRCRIASVLYVYTRVWKRAGTPPATTAAPPGRWTDS